MTEKKDRHTLEWRAGIDGCKGGWIAVFYPDARRNKAETAVFQELGQLLADRRALGIVAIDMPIGLPAVGAAGGRTAEHQVRARIGPRRNSVFGIPARAAVTAYRETYARVCAIARENSLHGGAPSIQAYNIFERITLLDAALRNDGDLARRVFEVHPELSFCVMNGEPLIEPKKRSGRPWPAGMEQRRALLLAEGYAAEFLDTKPPRGAARDDFFDACAAAWSAARIAGGAALDLPDEPEFDEFGLPMRICG